MTVEVVAPPLHGTLRERGPGERGTEALTYLGAPDFNGEDRLCFVAVDASGQESRPLRVPIVVRSVPDFRFGECEAVPVSLIADDGTVLDRCSVKTARRVTVSETWLAPVSGRSTCINFEPGLDQPDGEASYAVLLHQPRRRDEIEATCGRLGGAAGVDEAGPAQMP